LLKGAVKGRRLPGIPVIIHYGYLCKEDRLRKYEMLNRVDPGNEAEDCYRHIVQGDVPEVPASAVLRHAGPLQLAPYAFHVEPLPECDWAAVRNVEQHQEACS
jgi:hypothetical protein